MNKKYLFGMLLSGALLTACTADDALDAAQVAQDANLAPVFTVGLDNGPQNRAEYTAAGNKVTFQDGDKLSLYHGMLTLNATGLDKWQNAIYLAEEGGSDGKLKFSTHSMVQVGSAVMVWPADDGVGNMNNGTGGDNLGKTLKVRVEQTQKKADRAKVPYFSEIIEITKTGKTEDNASKAAGTAGTAGYGKEYDILLRRAAGTLQLKLDTDNKPTVDGADPFQIKAVEINMTGDGTKKPFSLALPVIKNTNITDNDYAKLHPDYKSWRYGTTLKRDADLDDDDKAGWIKTLDVENDIATFTLLPGVLTQNANFAACDGYVVVYTNWGKVKISHENKAYGAKHDEDINTRMAAIVDTLWCVNGIKGSEFEGEPTGGFAGTYAYVDLDSLDLNGMHIETPSELKTAIQVYKSVYKTRPESEKTVTLLLDGDKEGIFAGLDSDLLNEVKNQMALTEANDGVGLHFAACKEHACSAIAVEAKGTVEIPELLKFGAADESIEDNGAVEILLSGNWEFTKVTDISDDSKKNNEKVFANVSGLTLESGTLTLKNEVSVDADDEFEGFTIYGTVIVSGNVTLREDMVNYGTINIPEATPMNKLSVSAATLTNKESQKDKNASGLIIDQCGVINNWGYLVANKEIAASQVLNYGLIEQKAKNAVTLITHNSMAGNSLYKPFKAGENAIGTIKLYDKDAAGGLVGVYAGGRVGFIKLTIDKQENLTKDGYGDVANYIILDGTCTEIKTGEQQVGSGKVDYTPTNIKYFQVAETLSGQQVKFVGAFSGLSGLVVPAEKIINIPVGSSVTVNGDVYAKGMIATNGTFTYTVGSTGKRFAGYFGGAEGDKENVKAGVGQ